VALAICHCGAGTEAGSGICYLKFVAVRPGNATGLWIDGPLDAREALAANRGLTRSSARMNAGRHAAYRRMIARGFRTDFQGVTMYRDNESGYDRPDVHVIDDWR
jgi:hypothetical protein